MWLGLAWVFLLKSYDENCDEWLCASSTMECSAITVLTFFPRKKSSSGVMDSCAVSLSDSLFISVTSGFLGFYQLKPESIETWNYQVKIQCSTASAELVCAPGRIFLWDGLKWLRGLPHNFPVTWLVSCTECPFDFILAFPITTAGSLFTTQTKCCPCCFLWGGDERSSNMWEMVMVPQCDGTGDNVAIPPSTSWSLFPWNIDCYTLQKAKETCLGTDKEKRIVFCPAAPLFTEFILGASKHC